MRRLTVTAAQFRNIVYFSCITQPAKDMATHIKMIDVCRKLEGQALPTSDNPDDMGFVLIDESATFDFENAEAAAIVRRIKDAMPTVPFHQFRDAGDIIAQLERKPTDEEADVASTEITEDVAT